MKIVIYAPSRTETLFADELFANAHRVALELLADQVAQRRPLLWGGGGCGWLGQRDDGSIARGSSSYGFD